ncbi:MAG: response regulator [Halioglobus sp.]|nr:response regulator [Halioglobus sp.]
MSLRSLHKLGKRIETLDTRRYWCFIGALIIVLLLSSGLAVYLILLPGVNYLTVVMAIIVFAVGMFVLLLLGLLRSLIEEVQVSRDARKAATESELKAHRTESLERHKLVAIGQISGGLAHDFNNLLSIVVGNLDEVKESVPANDTVAHQQIDSALSAAIRGSEVTRALLSVAGRRPRESMEHNVNEIVQSIMPLVNSSVGADVACRAQFTDFSLSAKFDATGLNNAILNLANNARDAMKQYSGEKILTIKTRYQTIVDDAHSGLMPGNYAVIDVIDSGTGMDVETQKQMFTPFFTTKDKDEGTGLGMVMVRDYFEALGGAVTVRSEVGVGTAVKLFIPLVEELFAAQKSLEIGRLDALRRKGITDSSSEPCFDAIVNEAAAIFDAPVSAMILVDAEKLSIKAAVGIAAKETPRYGSFSAHTVALRRSLIVNHANTDTRFSGHPMVTSDDGLRFFAGVPLVDSDHYALGALCVIDRVARSSISENQLARLKALADKAIEIIEARSADPTVGNFAAQGAATKVHAERQLHDNPFAVLVVDDEPDLADLAATWLASFGWRVDICRNAAEALEQLSTYPYSILFTDIVMPGGMDGIELAYEAKNVQPGIQVLLASGYADRLRREEELPGELLTKPYRKSDLIDAVSRL